MSYAVEVERLGASYELQELSGGEVVEAIVWNRDDTVKTKSPDTYGLEDAQGDYNHLRAFLVTSDPEAWFNRGGGRKSAWVMEIYPVEGDVLVEDMREPVTDQYGNEVASKILITSRKVLVESVDFEYVREFTEDDLLEDDEEDDFGLEDEDSYDDIDGFEDFDDEEDE